jgi:hypothetical protein
LEELEIGGLYSILGVIDSVQLSAGVECVRIENGGSFKGTQYVKIKCGGDWKREK